MDRSTRKSQHIQHALSTGQSGKQGMDDIRFIPNSLPNLSYGDTKLDISLLHFRFSSPILINAMTGGSAQTTAINRNLAILAREKGLAMAVGSQMAALRDASLIRSYTVVREENPQGIVFGNVGAEATVEQARSAVEMLQADALQIHLNVMQELLMPEGDRSFEGYLRNIEQIVASIDVPAIVKEVGFGMSRQTVRQLADAGVSIIDVGGLGGTNFAKVENKRREKPLAMFEDWGLTTVQSLLEAGQCQLEGVSLIASGGIKNGLDIGKAIALGATAVGLAGRVLQLLQTQSMEQCCEAVDEWHHQLRILMTALGTKTLAELKNVPLTIMGETGEWAELRGIVRSRYANREMNR